MTRAVRAEFFNKKSKFFSRSILLELARLLSVLGETVSPKLVNVAWQAALLESRDSTTAVLNDINLIAHW